jgi:hypothetical protein
MLLWMPINQNFEHAILFLKLLNESAARSVLRWNSLQQNSYFPILSRMRGILRTIIFEAGHKFCIHRQRRVTDEIKKHFSRHDTNTSSYFMCVVS